MESYGDYVLKKEVDWSLLTEGFTLPIGNQIIFGRNMGKFLSKGESKDINLFLNGQTYKAKIRNVNFNEKYYRENDILQIRYPRNGDLSNEFKKMFAESYKFILNNRKIRDKDDRGMIKLPEDYKEYLIIYTTEYEDTYSLETIVAEEMCAIKYILKDKTEKLMEDSFDYGKTDSSSTIIEDKRIIKIRKLNRAIGDNLKLLYDYRCQICGKGIGRLYNSSIIEAHHIDHFIKSLNNDMDNIMVVCPNHHRIIHDVNPKFDKINKSLFYDNGFVESLKINYHL